MSPADLAEFIAAVKAAHAAMDGKGSGTPEWDAWLAIKERWTGRPHGRDAAPGDLEGWQLPGEWPHGGDIRCRRCGAVCSLEGHPHGCPRTPGDIEDRYCYTRCAAATADRPWWSPRRRSGRAVRIRRRSRCPAGADGAAATHARSTIPTTQPEKDYYVSARHPGMGDAWVHARCVDEYLIGARP